MAFVPHSIGQAASSLALALCTIQAIFLGGVSAQTQLSLACASTSGMMYLCTLTNWQLSLRTADQVQNGINFNIDPPSNSYRVGISVVCDGSTLQTTAMVSQPGYNTCNATVSNDGKIYKNSGTAGSNEVTAPSCYFRNPEILTVGNFVYNNNLQDTYYVIGTIGTSSSATQFVDINNQTGGACMEGLKARILVNWKQPPTTTAPTTVQTTTTAGTTASNTTPDFLGVVATTSSSALPTVSFYALAVSAVVSLMAVNFWRELNE